MRQDSLPIYTSAIDQVMAIKANNEAVLRALYQNHYYKVESFVLDNNGTVEQAKDIYQEAFITVWRNIQLDKFEPENENALPGYLYRIAKNKWLDHLRSYHHKNVIRLESHGDGILAEDLPEDENEYIRAVKTKFPLLGDNCQEVLTNFYYRKESLKSIAERFSWTEATAKNNKYRCLQRLRELMKSK